MWRASTVFGLQVKPTNVSANVCSSSSSSPTTSSCLRLYVIFFSISSHICTLNKLHLESALFSSSEHENSELLPSLQRCTKRWTCFAKQQPVKARQKFLATLGPPFSEALYACVSFFARLCRSEIQARSNQVQECQSSSVSVPENHFLGILFIFWYRYLYWRSFLRLETWHGIGKTSYQIILTRRVLCCRCWKQISLYFTVKPCIVPIFC